MTDDVRAKKIKFCFLDCRKIREIENGFRMERQRERRPASSLAVIPERGIGHTTVGMRTGSASPRSRLLRMAMRACAVETNGPCPATLRLERREIEDGQGQGEVQKKILV